MLRQNLKILGLILNTNCPSPMVCLTVWLEIHFLYISLECFKMWHVADGRDIILAPQECHLCSLGVYKTANDMRVNTSYYFLTGSRHNRFQYNHMWLPSGEEDISGIWHCCLTKYYWFWGNNFICWFCVIFDRHFCLCSLMVSTVFLQMTINTYFQNVWAGFADLGNNPVVFSVVLGTCAIYILLILWATRKDRKDRIKVRWNLILCITGHVKNCPMVLLRWQ